MSLVTDRPVRPAQPQPPSGGGRAAARRARKRHRARRPAPLAGRYIGYVLYFVGAGLISGAVVHHPLDPARYTKIAVIGVLVFLVATVVNEFLLAADRPALPRAILVIGASLLLSFGIGMLSGGLQHFEDFPARGALLVPLGITVSFIAFVLKDAQSSWRRIFGPVGLAVLLTAAVSFFGLRTIAAGMGTESGESGHSHGTGSAEEAGEHAEGEESPGTSSQPTAPEGTASPDAEDGHSH
ncbi:hypothetical protein ABZ078_20850 [Streptomyces sp. NPDC006385]|uniref:hypothetical protein n=1 Tax=Streptomyces sp. NPDC006385 TaxID=3156761 RepID=UPI0019CB5969|nr:hypothetical protein GCM10018771_67750 [Streptomyces cellulosae]